MNKQAISITLLPDNITFLKGRLNATGSRSISELMDKLVTAARTGGHLATPRSVVGTVEIDDSDPSLKDADAAVQRLFKKSLGAMTRRKPGKKTHRG